MKERLFQTIDGVREELIAMADDIFDHPETGMEEFHALDVLTQWLMREAFEDETGIAGVPTAFQAVFHHRNGGPNLGLLCEYDALPGLGHACGHHLQGPSILAAAKALKEADLDQAYTITVYGTPAEESISGKIQMIRNGCDFTDLDVAFMMHGGPNTQVDVKSLANSKYKVIYHGTSAHAALRPPCHCLVEQLAQSRTQYRELVPVLPELFQRGDGKRPLLADSGIFMLNNRSVKVYCDYHMILFLLRMTISPRRAVPVRRRPARS